MRGWPVRYRLYAPVHRLLTLLGSVRVFGRHPFMVVRNRINRALFRTVFRDPKVRLRHTRRGFSIVVRSNDQAAASIIFNGDYSPAEVDDAVARTPRDATFVDVGANYGFLSLAVASSVGCRVIAIEPNPALVECIRESVAINSPFGATIVVVDSACAAETGIGRLAFDDRLTSNGCMAEFGVPVHVRTVDDIVQDVIGPIHLKIDVEGGEVGVLQGARRTLESSSVVQCELSSAEAATILQSAGFMARPLKGRRTVSRGMRRVDMVFERK